ncbi:hypothetical protein AMS66_12845 [Paenibacillus xylanivorans]|uniref:Uncharacterized protein n=1 Tax=Paenibacillus xylanivorans TaxID=1705561 RepID=A0A0M9BPD2_9BACL|nr:hypothetical protein AMS66_12845 [Paenibacillus xylanivorans]
MTGFTSAVCLIQKIYYIGRTTFKTKKNSPSLLEGEPGLLTKLIDKIVGSWSDRSGYGSFFRSLLSPNLSDSTSIRFKFGDKG